jgi:hypothetical protein
VFEAGNEPDFPSIADFRKRHLATLKGIFERAATARALGAHADRLAAQNEGT